jgi:hypothetical protein
LRFIIETDNRCVVRILQFRQRNLERQGVARIETGIHVLEPREAFDEKSGSTQQDERQRHFSDDKSVAQTISSSALR